MSLITRRRFELLFPPTVIFLTVLGGIFVSPYSHLIPGMGRPCGLRELTGYPCLACGGTRSLQALAGGDVLAALKFNPLVFLAICAAGVWFVVSLWRAVQMSVEPSTFSRRPKSRLRWWLLGLAVVGVGNWLYLVKYLPA
jgi:hypothetical protein